MSFPYRAIPLAAAGTFAALLLGGCATARTPIRLDPAFAQRNIETIALFPIVDRRKDTSFNINLQDGLGERARKEIERRGYQVVHVAVGLDRTSLSRLMDMDAAFISSLAPEGTDAVAAVYVDDTLSSYKVLSYVFKIEATGTVVAKRDGTELWRDKGIGNQGQAGLISGLFAGMDRSFALDQCVASLFSTLPKSLGKQRQAKVEAPKENSREEAVDAAVGQAIASSQKSETTQEAQ